MWCALYTHVQTKGAMKPLRLIKHYTQFDYNKGKWGLDKCTELANEVRLQGKYGCEQKYICRLIDGVLVNSWNYDKSTIIKPWATEWNEKKGVNPTVQQIREKSHKHPLSRYVYNVSLDWLKALEVERAMMANIREEVALRAQTSHSPTRLVRMNEKKKLDMISKRKSKGHWPIPNNRALTFAKDEELNGLRKFKTAFLKHNRTSHPKTVTNKRGVHNCALCSIMGRDSKSRVGCDLCCVSLCTSKKYGFELSCFDAWHTAQDLEAEYKIRTEAAASAAKNPKHSGKKRKKGDLNNRDAADIALESAEALCTPVQTPKVRKRRKRNESLAVNEGEEV